MDKPTSPPQALRPVHATAVNLAINNSDFVLVFIQVMPVFADGALIPQAVMEPVTTVSLSPAVAKQLRNQLNLAISGFETNTGANIPDIGSINTLESPEKLPE